MEYKFCSALSKVCSSHILDSLVDWFWRILKIWLCWCRQEYLLCRHHCFKVTVKVKPYQVTDIICSYNKIFLNLYFLSFKHSLSGGDGWHDFREFFKVLFSKTYFPFNLTFKCLCNRLKIFLSDTPTSLNTSSASIAYLIFTTESPFFSMTLVNEYGECVNILVVTNFAVIGLFVYAVSLCYYLHICTLRFPSHL